MISHKHKCIFIHIPKVAGISIEEVFLMDLGLDFDNRAALLLGINTNANMGPPRLSHLKAEEIVELHFLSDMLFKSYFKFAFVRNPYDRVYSLYKYLGYNKFITYDKFVQKFLKTLIKREKQAYFFEPMYNYIYSKDEKLLVDFIGRFEKINEDFDYVKSILNIKNFELPHTNESSKMPFKRTIRLLIKLIIHHPQLILGLSLKKQKNMKYLSEKSKDIIYSIYINDFQNFGYSR